MLTLNQILSVPAEFDVRRKIGYGARSTVYECVYQQKTYAMKFLTQSSEVNKRLFLHEVESIRRLKQFQPNGAFLDFLSELGFRWDELQMDIRDLFPTIYLTHQRPSFYLMDVMEPLDVRRLSQREFLLLEQSVAVFLAVLRQLGAVYRDFSPRNIMRRGEGFVFIDFEELLEVGGAIVYPGQFKYQMRDEATFEADYLAAAVVLSERYQALPHQDAKSKEEARQIFGDNREQWRGKLEGLAKALAALADGV